MKILFTIISLFVSEISFIIGILLGTLINPISFFILWRSVGSFSIIRALVQGVIVGVTASLICCYSTLWITKVFSLPVPSIIWVIILLPALGEVGHFFNRFSIQHTGKADTGFYTILGRLHKAAWEPFRSGVFELAIEANKSNADDDKEYIAAKIALWFTSRAIWGFIIASVVTIYIFSNHYKLVG